MTDLSRLLLSVPSAYRGVPVSVYFLATDVPLLKAQIPDWRAMVDIVLIDTACDGTAPGGVFSITLSDVPEGETTVAVKIIDILGEEVLVTADV